MYDEMRMKHNLNESEGEGGRRNAWLAMIVDVSGKDALMIEE